MNLDEIDREAECGACTHSPAYHDQPGQACRAWDPDRLDWTCSCKKWTTPKPKYVPPPEDASW